MSRIIIPGRQQEHQVNGREALQMIIEQLNGLASEINIINLRLQVFQNIIIAKNVAGVPELEAEWNKLIEEAKQLSMNARLVAPGGGIITPSSGPQGAEGPTGATGETGPAEPLNVAPETGHA